LRYGPAVLLFALFVTAAILAANRRRVAVTLFGAGLMAVAVACWYDFTYGGPQITFNALDGKGCHHAYWTWWWYED
jgi:hypothetical protein